MYKDSIVRPVLVLATALWFLPISAVVAQTDGSAPAMGSASPADTGAVSAQGAGAPAPSQARATTTSGTVPTPTPVTVQPATQPPQPVVEVPIPTSDVATEEVSQEDTPSTMNTSALLGAVGVALLALIGISVAVKSGQKNNTHTDSNKCDSIKALLEQKRRELEDMVRTWPEEKLKKIAKNAVLTEIKKDETGKTIVETVDEVQAAYNKLKQAIDLLEMRFDLCTLSLPSVGGATYAGTIIENSLKDPKMLEHVKITKHYEAGDWKLKDVLVHEKQIKKLSEALADGPWYMHFWKENKNDGIVVFKDKQFAITYKEKETWKDAVAYGKELGIPEEQLDFIVPDR